MDTEEIELSYKGQPVWFLRMHREPGKVIILDDFNKTRVVRADKVMIPKR